MIYEVEYSKRRKTLGISVERDRRVIVHAPETLSPTRIEQIVESKREWIESKINDVQKYSEQPGKKEFVSGESLMLLGRQYRLVVSCTALKGVQFDGTTFTISQENQKKANDLFKKWYKDYALQIIEPIAKDFANKLGVNYNSCKIAGDMSFRWASCTPKGNIRFNWRIIKAPQFVIEYLIVHELAHLRISNHSSEFWNVVAIQVPNYREAKQWLKDNGAVLEVDF